MENKQNKPKSKKRVLFSMRLGRIHFLKQMINRVVFRYLSGIAKQQLEQGAHQVSVFAFDYIGHHINLDGIYERYELNLVIEYLKNNQLIKGSVLDIGANIGNHSLFFSKYYEHIYSFEPNPRTFQLLKMNASLVNNIECINTGLSDSEKTATLSTDPSNYGASSLGKRFNNTRAFQQEVKLRTLDSFADIYLHKIGLIKIDVEGHELAVLKGGDQFISKNRPTILFEQHLSEFKEGKSPTIEYLKRMGYKFASIVPAPAVPLWIPNFLRKPFIFILRLIFGLSYRVVEQDKLLPNSYLVIIAIP